MAWWYGCPIAWIAALVLAVPAQAAPSGSGTLARGPGADDIVAHLLNNGDQTLPFARLFLPMGTSASNISVSGDGGITSANSPCAWDAGLNALGCQFNNTGNW